MKIINQHNLSENNVVMTLLRKTERNELFWIPFKRVMQYLEDESIPLQSIQEIYSYLTFQQRSRYIPDMNNHTYICCSEENLVVLSQGSYSLGMRLTIMNLKDYKKKWKIVEASSVMLVRLRDTVELFGVCSSREDCQELLYSMGDISV